jgi:predicted lipid-binding transport protein (Tim44 family)
LPFAQSLPIYISAPGSGANGWALSFGDPRRIKGLSRLSLDLIFFAVVALVLGWRLYSVLGRRTGTERRIDPLAERQVEAAESAAPVQRLPSRTERERRQIEAQVAAATQGAQQGLKDIKALDPAFDAADFLAGAKIAFEMILGAYAKGDSKALRPMLSDQVFRNFSGAIEDRSRQGRRLETTLIGISTAEIAAAEFHKPSGEARITVRFTSQQVDVTKDSEGRIVEGDPNEVATIVDLWTFARPVKSRDPNWTLIATESP